MLPNFFFYLGLTLIVMHEMYAIRCREWRIFPLLSLLNDKAGHIVFLFVHIPSFFWIFWQFNHHPNLPAFIHDFDIFLVISPIFTFTFLKHKNNEFKDWISWTIIAGGGICGATDYLY